MLLRCFFPVPSHIMLYFPQYPVSWTMRRKWLIDRNAGRVNRKPKPKATALASSRGPYFPPNLHGTFIIMHGTFIIMKTICMENECSYAMWLVTPSIAINNMYYHYSYNKSQKSKNKRHVSFVPSSDKEAKRFCCVWLVDWLRMIGCFVAYTNVTHVISSTAAFSETEADFASSSPWCCRLESRGTQNIEKPETLVQGNEGSLRESITLEAYDSDGIG